MPPSFRKARKSLSRFRPFKSKRKSLRLRNRSPDGGNENIRDMPPVVLSGDGEANSYINDEDFHLVSGDESSKIVVAKEVTEEKNATVIVPERIAKETVSDARDDDAVAVDEASERESNIHMHPDPAATEQANNATEDVKKSPSSGYHTAAETDEPIQNNTHEVVQEGSQSNKARSSNDTTTNEISTKKNESANDEERESPNSNGQNFNDSDHVEVTKLGHKKYGRTGTIVRQTKCFVFIKEDKTGQLIKIKPASIALVSGVPDVDRPIEAVTAETVMHERTKFQSKSRSNRMSIEKPSDFPIRSSVTVVNTHAEHGGKVAIVQRHTARFVVIKSSHKEFRISPKFLVRNEKGSTDTISTITSSLPTESEFSGTIETERQSSTAGDSIASTNNAFALGNFTVGKICLVDSTKGVDCAFKMFWKAGNYLSYEAPLNSIDVNSTLPLSKYMNGQEYQLYYAEVSKDQSNGQFYNKSKKVTIYYVASDDLRAHEEKLGDFGSLPPSKVWARRKHFMSPAIKHKFSTSSTGYAIMPITANFIKLTEDLGTVGCGFIQEHYLEDLLGNTAEAIRCAAIQVRIFVPTQGVFKGMLMRSRSNTGPPILLNNSLRKVGPSRSNDASDQGYLVIKNKFPSKSNFEGPSRLFQPKGRPMTKSFKEDVRKGKLCKLSPMYARVMQSLGVAKETIEEYRRQYQKHPEKKLCHTHVVGVADPTTSLPPNSVYLTGTANASFERDQLLVSRSPCMEEKDIRQLNVIRTKPSEMADDDWNWLQSLAFGALIFANPHPGKRPLPELIAEGDLDGDLYFCCWSPTIMSEINPVPITSAELPASTAEASAREYDPNWLDSCQSYISEVHTRHSKIDKLIGNLYSQSHDILSDVRHPDAVSFARAYKEALDAKKHGKQIYLPENLWCKLDEDLHKYLVSD